LQKESEDFDKKKKKLRNNLEQMGELENSMNFSIGSGHVLSGFIAHLSSTVQLWLGT
jgi:hypothetical protein